MIILLMIVLVILQKVKSPAFPERDAEASEIGSEQSETALATCSTSGRHRQQYGQQYGIDSESCRIGIYW